MSYIELEVLEERIEEERQYLANRGELGAEHTLTHHVLRLLDDIPTADVVKVVYGKWIKMDKRGKNVRCSKCGNTLDLRGVNAGRGDADYCPNCGARMGDKDE